MIKTRNMNINRNFLNTTNNIYETLTANIIVNGEKLKVFSLRLGTRQGCPTLLFNIVAEVLERGIR